MAPETREALLAAATDLLDEGGPESVTMRQVGARAGLSHNAPYKHFTDKAHLLAVVAARELEVTARYLRGDHDGDPGLRGAMHACVARALRHPRRFRLVYGPWSVDSPELTEAAAATWEAMVELVGAETAAGRLAPGPPARTADLVRALVHGAVELALGGHLAKHDEPTAAEDLVDDLLVRLAPPGTPAAGHRGDHLAAAATEG